MSAVLAFVIGIVFGCGLLVSGMADPAKVLAFLDLAGRWDPSLAIVMAAAIPVTAVGYAIGRRRSVPLASGAFQMPAARELDRRLVLGSVTFGVGWGLVGLCPGPALVLAGSGSRAALVFVLAMVAGMLVFKAVELLRAQPAHSAAPQRPRGS